MKYDVVVETAQARAGGSSPGESANQGRRPSMEAGSRSSVGVFENRWRNKP